MPNLQDIIEETPSVVKCMLWRLRRRQWLTGWIQKWDPNSEGIWGASLWEAWLRTALFQKSRMPTNDPVERHQSPESGFSRTKPSRSPSWTFHHQRVTVYCQYWQYTQYWQEVVTPIACSCRFTEDSIYSTPVLISRLYCSPRAYDHKWEDSWEVLVQRAGDILT